MKSKRAINWLLLNTVLLFVTVSCQDVGNKNSSIQNDISQSEVDTARILLKETSGIRDIIEDSKGNIWFSSPDYVAKYNGKELYYFSENDGLRIVGNLHKDLNGTIWIEDGFEIFRYNGRRFIAEEFDQNCASHNLWFQRGLSPSDTSYVEPGIYKVHNKDSEFIPFPVKKDVSNKYLYFPTTKAFVGKDSIVWFGTMERVFGLKNNTFITIGREEMGRQNDERQIGIRGIFVDSNGKLWIADNGSGLFVYDGNETVNFSKKYNLDKDNVEGKTLQNAFSIAEDNEGNMWFGTVYSGIWMFNPKTEGFKNYSIDDGVKSENIWTIYKTSKGELLFAGESPGAVYKFNGENFDRLY